MTISIDWAGTHVIYVPKADMTQISPPPNEIRRLDMQIFRMALRDLEDDPDGRPWPKTHDHETETTLAGVTYARKVRILHPYTITFEDGQYAVDLYGANNNVADVMNLNQVSLRSNNSAGLITVATGAGPTPEEIAQAVMEVLVPGAFGNGTVGKRIGECLDAAVSTRAVAGDEMDLVSGAVDATALDASAVTEIQAGLATSTEVGAVQSDVDLIQLALSSIAGELADIGIQVTDIETIEKGRWKILEGTNHLVYYQPNGTTPLVTFHLFKKDGITPAIDGEDAAERAPE